MNGNGVDQEHAYELLKNIVQKAIGLEENPSCDRVAEMEVKEDKFFCRKNQDLESAIHKKMKKIEELEGDVK